MKENKVNKVECVKDKQDGSVSRGVDWLFLKLERMLLESDEVLVKKEKVTYETLSFLFRAENMDKRVVDVVTQDYTRAAIGSPLHVAARYNRYKAAKLLITAGADFDSVDSFGMTPLLIGLVNKNEEFVNLLFSVLGAREIVKVVIGALKGGMILC